MATVRRTWGGAAALALAISIPASAGTRGTTDDFSPDTLYTGDWVLIIAKGGQSIPCAGTEAGWAELIRIQRSGNAQGKALSRMREIGEVYEVVSGTEALVFEPSHVVPGLKLKSGKHVGQVCFTDRAFVQRYMRSVPRYYWFY